MKVYLVIAFSGAEGHYETWVSGVFASQERAQAYVDAGPGLLPDGSYGPNSRDDPEGTSYEIEEWDVQE